MPRRGLRGRESFGRRGLRAALPLGGLGLLLLALWATAPDPPAVPVAEQALPLRPVEMQEGIVLSVQPPAAAPGAPAAILGEGGPAAVSEGAPPASPTSTVEVRFTRGSQRGRTVQIELPAGSLLASVAGSYRAGDRVLVRYQPAMGENAVSAATPAELALELDRGEMFTLVDHVRWPWLLWGAGLFAAVVVLISGREGLRALIGLASAVGVFAWFVLPRLLAGHSPVWIGLAGCALTAVPSLLLTHGLNRRSLVPLVGIAGSLVVVAILAIVGVQVTRLSGLAADEESSLLYVGTHGAVDPQGLLLAGVLIGAVGALVDITVGQTAAVLEFRETDPWMPRRELFWRGMKVGRAHVVATVHTLVLAYAGAALPLLLLFALYAAQLDDVWNREMIVVEILRSVAGGIGLAAAMPLTTWVACLVSGPAPAAAAVAEGGFTGRPLSGAGSRPT
jgi:uncharacterized membrane protein